MIVLFIAAILGAIVLLHYWSKTLSTTKNELHDALRTAQSAEARVQFLVNENSLLWNRLLLLEQLSLSPQRHQLAFELHRLLPYLWHLGPNSHHVNELKRVAEPLVREINDPVITSLWTQGTLESINQIPLALIGQISEPGYDPRNGVVRRSDSRYPDEPLWP